MATRKLPRRKNWKGNAGCGLVFSRLPPIFLGGKNHPKLGQLRLVTGEILGFSCGTITILGGGRHHLLSLCGVEGVMSCLQNLTIIRNNAVIPEFRDCRLGPHFDHWINPDQDDTPWQTEKNEGL